MHEDDRGVVDLVWQVENERAERDEGENEEGRSAAFLEVGLAESAAHRERGRGGPVAGHAAGDTLGYGAGVGDAAAAEEAAATPGKQGPEMNRVN